MKFALIHDSMAISSYYVKDKTAYAFKDGNFNNHQAEKDKPYVYHHSVSPECYIAMQNLPFLFEEGCYLNWREWEELPDMDLDLIFFGVERNWNLDGSIKRPEVSVETLKKKYPNAKILSWIKEVWVGEHFNYQDPRHLGRIEHLKECDGVITSGISKFPKLEVFDNLRENVDIPFYFIPQPVNTDYFYDEFYSNQKEECLYAYLPNPHHRRGETYNFVSYLSNKYKIPVKHKELSEGQKFDYLSQKDFIKLWSSCAFHFNLDPIDWYPGNQVMQVAATGTINIGGENESHHILFPETAGCDTKYLEEIFVELLNNPTKRFEVIQYSWNKLHEVFSFESVKKQIDDIYKEL